MARAVLFILIVAFLPLPLQAADVPAKRPRQVPLTARLVENFIASYEPVKAFNAKYDKAWGNDLFSQNAYYTLVENREGRWRIYRARAAAPP